MSRPLFTFTAVLCAAVLLGPFVPGAGPLFYIVAVAAAVALAAASPKLVRPLLGRSRYLCDTCKYDDPRYCSRPERPNATACADYGRRG